MAVLALGAIGAMAGSAIGGTFLGMSAASIGWSLGAMVGSAAFAPKMPDQFGPRLGDLKVQSSTVGNSIPIVYGAARVAGNVIWSADIAETSHSEEVGGKGGGGVTSTTYTYSQSFAIALCEGEIQGIRKIWANGKLIYNLSDTADAATVIASLSMGDSIRVYTGSETQTADSLIEAHVGAADTPAYRGTAYVVFENMQLQDYGNRMPNLEFEVVENGTPAHVLGDAESIVITDASLNSNIVDDPLTNSVWVTNRDSSPSYVAKINIDTLEKTYYSLGSAWAIGCALDSITRSVWVGGDGIISKVNIDNGRIVEYAAGRYIQSVVFDQKIRAIWATSQGSGSEPTISRYDIDVGTVEHFVMSIADYFFEMALDSASNKLWVLAGNYLYSVSTISAVILSTTHIPELANNGQHLFFDSTLRSVLMGTFTGTGNLIRFNVDALTYTVQNIGGYIAQVATDSEQNIWLTTNSSTIKRVDAITQAVTDFDITTGFSYSIGYSPSLRKMWFGSSSNNEPVSSVITEDYGIAIVPTPLSSIVTNICTRAGLTAPDIDVTELTDEVHGYVVQRGTARSQIEQLMQAFYFDAVESDGVIKFVKRGGASAVTIQEDDLAAHVAGGAMPDNLLLERKQEMELPVEVSVQYLDADAAYMIGSQRSQRLTTTSSNKLAVNLALALTPSKAKQISDVLMYDAWTSRTSFKLSTGWKYSYLEPTDVVDIVKGARTYTVRLTEEDAAGGLYSRTASMDDAFVYTQTATAATLPVPSDTVAPVPITDLLLLDIPLLRDVDDGYGFYAAACGYSAGWHGAQPFKSNDGGATWSSFGSGMLNAATIGSASSVLGDFTRNIFDESNSVTVVLLNGTLSSATELNVLNGSNVALLGNEIVQFKTATLTATDTYLLSGLLRGRQGTEWARSTHAVGDRFVLLTASTIYPMFGAVAEYDLDREYKGVSLGGFLDDALSITFANTAVEAIPYSPVHLGGGRNAAGDLTLNWIRRTRLSGGWNNYSDVPLGEATEAYVVEIYDDAAYTTVLRTITGLTSATTDYTAAQQTTDFGSPQATVYWKVYQVSATVGNGYEARGAT